MFYLGQCPGLGPLTPRVYLEWLLVTEDAAGADSFGDKLSAVVPAFLL